MAQKSIIRTIDSVISKEVERAHGATIQVLLGPDESMPHFYTRLFTLQPGGRIPKHRHDTIEHEQVLLSGEMVLTMDGKEHEVREGMAIYIPIGCAHAYENRSKAPVRFICIVPAIKDYRTEWLD